MESPMFKRAKFLNVARAIEKEAAEMEAEGSFAEMTDGMRRIAAVFTDRAVRLSHDLGIRCPIEDCAQCAAREVA